MMSALKGREGGPGKADEVREFSKGGCVKMLTGGRGSNNRKILRTSYMEAPLQESCNLPIPVKQKDSQLRIMHFAFGCKRTAGKTVKDRRNSLTSLPSSHLSL